MKPAPFEYQAPASLEAALDALARHGGDAKLLAGGQSLIPVMNFRLAEPALLVDINKLGELDFIRRDEEGHLRIGAMVRQRRLERDPLVAGMAPLLHEAVPFIAHPQIRNRGTFGGSLAHADPAAELPALAVALDARFRLRSVPAAIAGWRPRTSSPACSPPPWSRTRCWSRPPSRHPPPAPAGPSWRSPAATATMPRSASRRG